MLKVIRPSLERDLIHFVDPTRQWIAVERGEECATLFTLSIGHRTQKAGRQASLAGFLIAIKLIPGDLR